MYEIFADKSDGQRVLLCKISHKTVNITSDCHQQGPTGTRYLIFSLYLTQTSSVLKIIRYRVTWTRLLPNFFLITDPNPPDIEKKTYLLGPGYQAYPGKTLPASLCHHYSYPTSPFSWGGKGAKLHPSSLLTRSLLQAVVAISKMFINSSSIQNLRDLHSLKTKAKPQSI